MKHISTALKFLLLFHHKANTVVKTGYQQNHQVVLHDNFKQIDPILGQEPITCDT